MESSNSYNIPYNVVYIPEGNVQKETAPLIGTTPHYAIYHPKGAISYARKSRTNCCFVVSCFLCTICCCFFFISSLILGSFIAAYAVACGSVYSDLVSFSTFAGNLTQIQIVNHWGPISITTLSDPLMSNITISVKRKAASQGDLNSFSQTFYVQNNQLYFEEQLPSSSNLWENLLHCESAEIEVRIPINAKIPIIISKTEEGSVDIDISSSYIFDSVQVSTTNGNINLKSFSCYSISGSSTNGELNLQNLFGDYVELSTTNGGIYLSSVTLMKNGKYPAFLSGSTTNGGIDAQKILVQNTTSIDFSSTNGGITFDLDNFLGNFNAQTTNGGVDVSGKNVQYSTNDWNHKQGTIGMGSSNCNLKTTNGGVSLSFN